jgi:excisionase family DNA binding protein
MRDLPAPDRGHVVSGEILTAEQLAERWQVKVQHVYRMTRDGAIPCIPLPGKYRRYRLDTIEAFERGELDSADNAA